MSNYICPCYSEKYGITQPGFIQWMFPVMQIMIDTRAQRHSRADHEFE